MAASVNARETMLSARKPRFSRSPRMTFNVLNSDFIAWWAAMLEGSAKKL
jgi:hypothetical protein